MLALHTRVDGRHLYEQLGFRETAAWLELAVGPFDAKPRRRRIGSHLIWMPLPTRRQA